MLFVGGGVVAFQSLPIEAFPDVTDIQVTVITLFPGHAPEEVEKQVTMPLEIGLSGLPNAVRMFSHTQFGLSLLILTFDDKANDYFARQQVLERLQGVDLPDGVQPQLAPLSTAIGEIYRYRVNGDGIDATELRTLQDWVVARYLKLIPGVADVVSFGGFIKQYQVTLDTAQMKSHNITLQQVFTALGRGQRQRRRQLPGAGRTAVPHSRHRPAALGRRHRQHRRRRAQGGTPLLIKDIAERRRQRGAAPGHRRPGRRGRDRDRHRADAQGRESVGGAEGRQGARRRLNESILPKGVRIVPFYDRTTLIDTTLHTVFKNLLEGALLVTLVLYLFLGNLRARRHRGGDHPAGAARHVHRPADPRHPGEPALARRDGLRHHRGRRGDRAGEHLPPALRSERTTHHRVPKADDPRGGGRSGTADLFSMLIIIIAHMPIFTLQRQEGRIFAPMAYTIVSALIGSLLFSLTLVPLLALFLLRRRRAARREPRSSGSARRCTGRR